MDLAFLISTGLWMAWFIYGLRITGERDRLRAENEWLRYDNQVVVVYGDDMLSMSPLQRLRMAGKLSVAAHADGFGVSRPRGCGN